jgi:hypothetical protein
MEQESDPELSTDPDPNLQIISDPSGSGCTTLVFWLLVLKTMPCPLTFIHSYQVFFLSVANSI